MKKQLLKLITGAGFCSLCGSALLTTCIVPSLILAQVPGYVPKNGLVGWWPFNGNANDESVFSNDGNVYGVNLTTDRQNLLNSAYHFKGGSSIVVNNNSAFSFNNGLISLSAWIYMPNASYNSRIISKDRNDHTNRDFCLKITSTGLVQFTAFTLADNNRTVYSKQILKPGNWIHLAITKDNEKIKLFINGVVDNILYTSTIINSTSANLFFGKTSESWNEYFYGTIDDIGIWNRALTDQEILNIYNGQSAGFNEINITSKIQIYPNPTKDILNLVLKQDDYKSYGVFDNMGRKVKEGLITEKETQISLETLQTGMYHLKVGMYELPVMVAKE